MISYNSDTSTNHCYSLAIKFAKVRAAKEDRARRRKYLPAELFSEPGWDILLELYSFQLVGNSVTESELVGRLAEPSTVSIRWLKMLETHLLLARTVDSLDPTQIRVELTSRGVRALDGYFADWPSFMDWPASVE